MVVGEVLLRYTLLLKAQVNDCFVKRTTNNYLGIAYTMALKQTSQPVAISFSISESAANTFTQEQVDLTLSPLDNEVFVVLAVDLNVTAPEAITSTRTAADMVVTKSSQTALQNLGNTNTVASIGRGLVTTATDAPAAFQHSSLDTPVAELPYVNIIATNNFFVGIIGTNNAIAMSGSGRLWGYRARADAATYAALVQSEVLSA